MHIDDHQSKLLQEMAAKLDKLGIIIGILTPHLALIPDQAEFVLRLPVGEYETPMLLHREDLILRKENGMLVHEPVEYPQHDEEVQSLLDTINEAIFNGEIFFDPSVMVETPEMGKFEIIQRDLSDHPKIGCRLYELPLATSRGNLWTYKTITRLSEEDARFLEIKQEIDKAWPDEKDRLFRSQVAEAVDRGDYDDDEVELPKKPAVKPTQKYVSSKLMRALRRFFGM